MATPASVPTTTGELLFQDYLALMRYPYEFEKEFPGKKKRPDYTVTRNGVFLFDVKDFDPYMPLWLRPDTVKGKPVCRFGLRKVRRPPE
jgi:hypothetical protein